MFIQMLKNQRVTFVTDALQAEAYSPFTMRRNPNNGRYIVSRMVDNQPQCVAAGMDLEEAKACIMFKANEYIFRKVQGV